MKKLRNAGGIESYFSDETADILLAQNSGWIVLEESAPAAPEPEASSDEITPDEAEESAPKPRKARK